MAEQPQAPVLISPIPSLVVNEGGQLGPMDLNNFIRSPNTLSGPLRFSALLADGRALPSGIACSETGILSGTPGSGTIGEYSVTLTVENDSDMPLMIWTKLSILPSASAAEVIEPIASVMAETPPVDTTTESLEQAADFLPDLKTQVWKALGENAPIPEMEHLLLRPLTPVELYYLLERFAVLTIWDVYNLESPGEKTLLTLPDNSPHYHIYDRGSCLVAAPKELFSHKRTLGDALQAAKAMAREVYKRGWAIEFAGFNKMARAAWVELQCLGDKHKKNIDILHYTPSPEDIKVYTAEVNRPSPSV